MTKIRKSTEVVTELFSSFLDCSFTQRVWTIYGSGYSAI